MQACWCWECYGPGRGSERMRWICTLATPCTLSVRYSWGVRWHRRFGKLLRLGGTVRHVLVGIAIEQCRMALCYRTLNGNVRVYMFASAHVATCPRCQWPRCLSAARSSFALMPSRQAMPRYASRRASRVSERFVCEPSGAISVQRTLDRSQQLHLQSLYSPQDVGPSHTCLFNPPLLPRPGQSGLHF